MPSINPQLPCTYSIMVRASYLLPRQGYQLWEAQEGQYLHFERLLVACQLLPSQTCRVYVPRVGSKTFHLIFSFSASVSKVILARSFASLSVSSFRTRNSSSSETFAKSSFKVLRDEQSGKRKKKKKVHKALISSNHFPKAYRSTAAPTSWACTSNTFPGLQSINLPPYLQNLTAGMRHSPRASKFCSAFLKCTISS